MGEITHLAEIIENVYCRYAEVPFHCTFEIKDTNNRPSTSSSSGCIATVNDGLWATVGEGAAAFQSLPREFPQRLLILFLFLWYLGDDPGVDAVELGVTDVAVGAALQPRCASGVLLTSLVSSLGFTHGRSWTSTSSPRACLPLMQGTYGSFLPAVVDMMGFRTSRVTCGGVTATVWFSML